MAALERDAPEERAAYLHRVCGPDLELYRRIERLLRAHHDAGDFLRGPEQVRDLRRQTDGADAVPRARDEPDPAC